MSNFTKPMTEMEWERWSGEKVPSRTEFNDPQVRATAGYGAAITTPANPEFQAAEAHAKKKEGNFMTRLLGLNPAVDIFAQHIAANPLGSKLVGGTPEGAASMEKPSLGQMAGAIAQTASTAVAPAIAPFGLPAQMAVGATLGYTYDVGADLIAQKSVGETLAPGVGTAVGVAAPPILNKAIGVSTGVAALIGRTATQQVPRLTQGLASLGEGAFNVAKQGVDEVASKAGRAARRGADYVTDMAGKADRIKNAPARARPAIRTGINDDVIRLATESNPQTVSAMREMVRIAEQGAGKAGTGPGRIAADKAVEQLHIIEAAKRDIGAKIGEASRNLPQAQNIDMGQAVRSLDDILSQNGIIRQADGTFAYNNKAITPEQKRVIENLYKLATEDSVLSAQQIHQMDQLFSKLQRQANVIDKVENIFLDVPIPEGQTKVNLFKVFRDVFSKQLDKLSPDMRTLNSEYRKLTNLVDDIESSIAKTPGFESLPMNDNYAEAGLRQMFGRGQKADQMVDLYEIMDSTARSLGYQGPRADDLYQFALELNRVYPENIPPTSFEGGIISGISQAIRRLGQVGRVTPADQQRALRKLLEIDTPKQVKINQDALKN